MSAIIIFISMVFKFSAAGVTIEKYSSKYPNNLLTPGYNITTEDDLAFDSQRRKIGPYNPKVSLSELYWQCFPVDDVSAGFNAWVGPDGMDRYDSIHTMCSIEIRVRANNEMQLFVDRRGHQIEFCLDFANAWKMLTAKQKVVCLNGEGGGYNQDKELGEHKLWTWVKFKTRAGCYSYFAEECNTSKLKK